MEIIPFDPGTLIVIAVLNPLVIVVAFLMGQRADQWQKLPIAAFAASLAGFAGYWLLAQAGFMPVHALGSESGLFVFQFLFGLVWAIVAYRFFHR
jgi:hypothetical protein